MLSPDKTAGALKCAVSWAIALIMAYFACTAYKNYAFFSYMLGIMTVVTLITGMLYLLSGGRDITTWIGKIIEELDC
jgi:hypothetical protein